MSIESTITLVAAGLAFIASLVAAAVSLYNARFRRFTSERWWERKAETYAKVVGSLVILIRALEWRFKEELGDGSISSPEVIHKELQEAIAQIERVATEGDYILSAKASNALLELLKQLGQPESLVMSDDWAGYLNETARAAERCLKTVRDEAKSDLRVK